jgi:aspartate--ammonia ligase
MTDNKDDLTSPENDIYIELEKFLPDDYSPILDAKETQIAIFKIKNYIEENLRKELNLIQVTVPLIVDAESCVNDMLDRDGSKTPIGFHIANDMNKNPIDAQIVQAATKWKRMALKQFGIEPGEGILTDMRAIRKDEMLDHDHSIYVDQWDWELAVTPEQRNLEFLREVVKKIWKVLKGAETHIQKQFPQLKTDKHPNLPDEITFVHAEDLLEKFPDLHNSEREKMILKDHPAVFLFGIGWVLDNGKPHEMRAADYDDWVTETISEDGRPMHGLNGDIITWNPITQHRHELSSMGVRVNAETLKIQLDFSGQQDFLNFPYHKAIINNEIPLSIGGGIGQSRTFMLLLKKAHIGEVSATVWPKILKDICKRKNIPIIK